MSLLNSIQNRSKKHEFPLMEDIKTFMTENGRYQIATSSSIKVGTSWWIHETIIDTRNGEVVGRDSYVQKHYTKHK